MRGRDQGLSLPSLDLFVGEGCGFRDDPGPGCGQDADRLNA